MLSSTNTVWASRKLRSRIGAVAITLCLAAMSNAQVGDLKAPADAIAGNPASITAAGSGTATFYLVGPTVSLKTAVQLGQISIAPQYLQSSGRYSAIVCTDSCRSVEFFVQPAKPVSLTFLVHPSRVPVGQSDAISGVALTFDEFKNLVFAPATVGFQLAAGGTTVMTRPVSTQGGIAWFRTNSGKSAGPLQILASIGDVSARRVVRQVAADPCSLHIRGQRNSKGFFTVETDPVRDCSGNPVPDGTVVTFTAKAGTTTSTVDAPIKQGIARAQMTAGQAVSVSAASGVVMGNELRLGAQ